MNKAFQKFDAMMQKLIRVPHGTLKAALDAEKAKKKRRPKKTSASGRERREQD